LNVRQATWVALFVLVPGCDVGSPAPEPFSEPQTLGGVAVVPEVLNRGKRVYRQFCMHCHGDDGSGRGPAGRALANPPRDFRAGRFPVAAPSGDRLPTDRELLQVVEGGRVEGGMPAFPMIPPDDRQAVVQYIKTFSPQWRTGGEASP
jgi:mono/diheme cytochrome c family protein